MRSALFVTFSAPDTGVFESQVLEYGQFMLTLGIEFRYLLFEGLRSGLDRRDAIERRLGQLRDRYKVRIEQRYVPSPVSALGRSLAGGLIRREVESLPGPGILVQARGASAVCAVLGLRRRIGRLRVLYDARGDEAAESRLEASLARTPGGRRRWLRRASRVEHLERRACVEADHLLAVSAPLRDHLCALGGTSPDRVTVVPCCVEPSRVVRHPSLRREVRRRLGLDDRFVLVYSGSLTTYQLPERVAALSEALKDRLPRTHLLLLTGDRKRAASRFSRLAEAGAVTVVEPDYQAVGDYLAAADAALLLRQDDAVNRVACPVKFAEYAVSGLPVIGTPHIGDISTYIRETGHGVLVDLAEPAAGQASRVAAAIASVSWPDRSIIRQQAMGVFCRDRYREAYRSVLERLGVGPDPALAAHAPRSGDALGAGWDG